MTMTTAGETDVAVAFSPHPLCQLCWDFVTHRRAPVRLPQEERQYEECCRCGLGTTAGIYWRADAVVFFHCSGHES